jgi:hypothetical protein
MIRLLIGLRILRGPRRTTPPPAGSGKRRALLGICCVIIAASRDTLQRFLTLLSVAGLGFDHGQQWSSVISLEDELGLRRARSFNDRVVNGPEVADFDLLGLDRASQNAFQPWFERKLGWSVPEKAERQRGVRILVDRRLPGREVGHRRRVLQPLGERGRRAAGRSAYATQRASASSSL